MRGERSRTSCLGHLLLCLDDLNDAVGHLLNGLVLSETHATLVGDVIDTTFSLSVLTTGATHLQVVLASNLLELSVVSGQLGDLGIKNSMLATISNSSLKQKVHLDVHRGTDSGAQVGGAEGEEAKTVVVGEGHALLNVIDGRDQTTVDLSKITTWLHGDEAHMVLLIAPDQEGLGFIVEDTTASGPVTAGIGSLKIQKC
jgi:hypothetical protein